MSGAALTAFTTGKVGFGSCELFALQKRAKFAAGRHSMLTFVYGRLRRVDYRHLGCRAVILIYFEVLFRIRNHQVNDIVPETIYGAGNIRIGAVP